MLQDVAAALPHPTPNYPPPPSTIDGTRHILEASWVGIPIHVVPLTRTDHDPQLHRYWS
jgi:hypothetical protein